MQTNNNEPQEVRASVLNAAAAVGAVDTNVLRFDNVLPKSLTPAAGAPPNIRAATTVNNGTIWTVTRRGRYLSILSCPGLERAGGVTFAVSLNATNLNALPVLNAGGMLKTQAIIVPAASQMPMELKFDVDVYDSDLVTASAFIRFHAFGSDEAPVAISELALAIAQAQVIYMGDPRG